MEDWTYRRLGAWQRALDMLVELHAMCAHMSERDVGLIGRQMWHFGMVMISEVALMCDAPHKPEKMHHLFCARQALSRFETRIFIARQLNVIDVDDEFLRQLERQRLEFERLNRHFEQAQS